MDHAEAHIIPYSAQKKDWPTIRREQPNNVGRSANKGEKRISNKKNNCQQEFYDRILNAIAEYPQILLFGPTNAKQELYNLIRKSPQYDKLKITVENSGQMTGNEMFAYVKEHFKPIAFGLL